MLLRLGDRNLRWREYDRFLISENRWRAQRYGVTKGLIDFGAREIKPFETLLSELIEFVKEDAEALDCSQEVERLEVMLSGGTSASRQRAVYADAPQGEGMTAVVRHLVDEFQEGL
jgi:carboxylate-amine ligase